MTDALVAVSLEGWTTEQLGRAYVDLLRRGPYACDSALQTAWAGRPKAERMAVLRRIRDEAAVSSLSA